MIGHALEFDVGVVAQQPSAVDTTLFGVHFVDARRGWAVGSEPNQVFNRRWFMKEGTVPVNPFGEYDKVKMNPPRGENLVKPAGPTARTNSKGEKSGLGTATSLTANSRNSLSPKLACRP